MLDSLLSAFLTTPAINTDIPNSFKHVSYRFNQLPIYLKNNLIQEMIVWILEYQHLDPVACAQSICKKLYAQMACKAAIKAGDVLTQEQMQQLLKDLAITNNRFSCPHGRPTGFLLTLEEIEHTFKRR